MKLDEVRELKTKLLGELEELSMVEWYLSEARQAEAEFTRYADRLVALMNTIEKGSDFRIAFKREGEDTFTNVLQPWAELGEGGLRHLALACIIYRLEHRAAQVGMDITVVEQVTVPDDE